MSAEGDLTLGGREVQAAFDRKKLLMSLDEAHEGSWDFEQIPRQVQYRPVDPLVERFQGMVLVKHLQSNVFMDWYSWLQH